jgi:hypothetical protein
LIALKMKKTSCHQPSLPPRRPRYCCLLPLYASTALLPFAAGVPLTAVIVAGYQPLVISRYRLLLAINCLLPPHQLVVRRYCC